MEKKEYLIKNEYEVNKQVAFILVMLIRIKME